MMCRLTYPRLDPAVISVVECCGHVLLGQNVRWNTGRFSALAGFVEMGESLEQAVSREVAEESGVQVLHDPHSQRSFPYTGVCVSLQLNPLCGRHPTRSCSLRLAYMSRCA
jgi:NADH pyrophosphatase NudC (nudix superfamily)